MNGSNQGGVAGKLHNVNDVIEAGLSIVPTALIAYKLFYAIWSASNPGKSFQEYNDYLYSKSSEVVEFSKNWFAAHGYTQQADGSWTKDASPTPPEDETIIPSPHDR